MGGSSVVYEVLESSYRHVLSVLDRSRLCILSLIIAVTVFYLALMTVCYSKHYNHILLLQDQVYSNARSVFNSVGIYVPTQVHTEKYYGPICTINLYTI